MGDVIVDGLGGGEMEADRAAPGALFGDADGGAVRVLVKVLDAEPAAGGEAGPRVEVELEDGPIAVIEDSVAGGQPHELAGAGGGEGPGFLAGIGGVAAEELGVGRIGDGDGQPELGRGGLEVFEE